MPQSGEMLLSALGRQWVGGFKPDWYPVNQTSHHLFRNGLPDISRFPFKVWQKLASKYLLDQPDVIFDFNSDQAGHVPLRAALAQYLGAARAVNCRPENVMMLTGVE